jgi:hypothetical protein
MPGAAPLRAAKVLSKGCGECFTIFPPTKYQNASASYYGTVVCFLSYPCPLSDPLLAATDPLEQAVNDHFVDRRGKRSVSYGISI